jgi:hypothetical protein
MQLYLAKQRYESIKGAVKDLTTDVWTMEGGRGEFNTHAATMECFTFDILHPAMAGLHWANVHTWMGSGNLPKLGNVLRDWIALLDIMKRDPVRIVLKACHGWIGEPATLFTCITLEEKDSRFATIAKKNRMIDTTLMTTPWQEHPGSPLSPRQVLPHKPRPIVSLADRVEMDDVTTTMTLVDAGGHTYYMTHVPRWGRLHSMDRNRISHMNNYLTF